MTALQELLGSAHILLAVVVSAHIVLTKDDVRAAIGWTGLVWLTPVVGSVLYALFGINRIRRRPTPPPPSEASPPWSERRPGFRSP